MNRLKHIWREKNLMTISQVLFWLGAAVAFINPFPELVSILIFAGFLCAALIVWILSASLRGSFAFRFHAIDGIAIAGILVLGAGTLLSKDPWFSFWGAGTSLSYSFVLFLLLFLSYFYMRLTPLSSKGRTRAGAGIWIATTAAGIIPVIGQFVHVTALQDIGGSLLMSQAYLLISFFIALTVISIRPSKKLRIIGFAAVFADALAMVLFNALPVMLLALLVILTVMLLTAKRPSHEGIMPMAAGFICSLILMAGILFPVRVWLHQSPLISINLPWLMHLPIIGGAWGQSALFGFGLGNFSQAFYAFKPLSFNLLPYFTVGFSFGRDIVLEIAVTAGILGLAALLAFGIQTLVMLAKQYRRHRSGESLAMAGIWVLILVISLLYLPTTSFLLLAAAVSALAVPTEFFPPSIRLSAMGKGILAYGGTLLILASGYYFIYFKAANCYLLSSLSQNNRESLMAQARHAQRINPQDVQNYLALANLLQSTSEGKLSDESKKELQALYSSLAPRVARMEDLIVYATSMMQYAQQTGDAPAVLTDTLRKIREEDPLNPFYDVSEAGSRLAALMNAVKQGKTPNSLTAQQMEEISEIQKLINAALELKPDYAEAKQLKETLDSFVSGLKSKK